MTENLGIDILAQFRDKSPLRIAGNLLLGWLLCMGCLLIFSFPFYPQTGIGWLWYIIVGPLVIIAGAFALGWVGWGTRWLGRKDPELRLWENILIIIALFGLVAWGIHSVP